MALKRRHKQTLAAVVVLVLVLALGATAFVLHRTSDNESGVRPMYGIVGPPMPERCGHGSAPHQAPSVASAPLANSGNMTYSVWCTSYPSLAEGFGSGVRITMGPNTFPDPTSAMQQMAQQDGRGAALKSIQGVPALEEDALDSPDPGRYGSVWFVIDGLSISVYGNGQIALPDLIAIAESISPALPKRPLSS